VPYRKSLPVVLALVLLLLLAPLALAQNPPLEPKDVGLPIGLILGCWCAAALVGIAIKVGIMVFIYKDAQARGTEPMLWLVLAFFFDVIVLIVWLIVRPPLGGGPRYY